MGGRQTLLYDSFKSHFKYTPTDCQDRLFRDIAAFASDDEGDILVVNGYAGTGKTSAVSAVVAALSEFKVPTVLMAPTGRAAKVLSSYTGRPAYTIHKHIYRQKSAEGAIGEFSLAPNKLRDSLLIVDEVSLIGIDQPQQQSMSLFGSGNLLSDLVRFARNGAGCKLILVGDAAQLPPVGLTCSPALSEELMSTFGGVRFNTLSTVVRQQKESGILLNATSLRNKISDPEFYGCTSGELGLRSGMEDCENITGGELIEALTQAYSDFGDDGVVVLCRSNKRAVRYNAGIRSMVQYKEERLGRDDKLMIVKNCYQFCENIEDVDFLANGDIVRLERLGRQEERYGLHFADATLSLPDYGDQEFRAKVILDTLDSESASLTYEQQNALYEGVMADYAHITSKKKRYEAVREDHFYNALQLKHAEAITCHKSQGGQWDCVFIDNPFWQDEILLEDIKWLYTAVTRAVKKVYFVNFKKECFTI